MKAQFKDWLITNHHLFDIDNLLSKVTDNLDIVDCNDIELDFIQEILSDFFDTLPSNNLARLC